MNGRGAPKWCAVVVALCLMLLTGCQVTLRTEVVAKQNGSGEVIQKIGFDAEALKRAGNPREAVRADDLVAAGWVVDPEYVEGDMTWLRIRHSFANVEEANKILAQLSGPDGPYKDLQLKKSDSFFTNTVQFRGILDTTAGLSAFTDKALTDALGGDASGGLIAAAETATGKKVSEMVEMNLFVDVSGEERTFNVPLFEPQQSEVKVTSTHSKLPQIFEFLLLTFLVVATAVVIGTRVRQQRMKSRRLMRPSMRR